MKDMWINMKSREIFNVKKEWKVPICNVKLVQSYERLMIISLQIGSGFLMNAFYQRFLISDFLSSHFPSSFLCLLYHFLFPL